MPTEIAREQVRKLIQAGAQLVEVLPRKEFDEEHIPGAVSLPLKALTAETASSLSSDAPIIVYCWDTQCDLSPRAAWRLESLGFDEVFDYVGGKADWLAGGLRTEGTNAREPRAEVYARRDVVTCSLSDRVRDVGARMGSEGREVCVVTNDGNVVMGRLHSKDITPDDSRIAEQAMESGPSTFRPNVSLSEMAEYMSKRRMDSALITTNTGVLVGILYLDDVEEALASASGAVADPAGSR